MANFHPGYLERGQPLGAISSSVVLGSDDIAVVTDGVALIYLYSDSATASARTITLSTSSLPGQLLTLTFESASSFTCQLQNSGNCRLVADWTPVAGESLNVRWDGTYWNEMSRSKVLVAGQANIDIADLAPDVMAEATGSLTSAQILALSATPITLVAAPGAGKAVIIDELEIRHTYSTAVYANGGDVFLQYTTGSVAIIDIDKTIVTAGSSANSLTRPTVYDLDSSTGTATGFDILAVANSAVSLTNATAAFINGNAANILKYRLRYHTVTLQA